MDEETKEILMAILNELRGINYHLNRIDPENDEGDSTSLSDIYEVLVSMTRKY